MTRPNPRKPSKGWSLFSSSASSSRRPPQQQPLPPSQSLSWMSILLIFSLRMAFSYMSTAADCPDEWWQSVEVAYNVVFGKGYLSWEWQKGIRPFTFPLMFAAPFYALKQMNLDTPFAVWFTPRLIMAILATGIDVCVFALGARIDAAMRMPLPANGKRDEDDEHEGKGKRDHKRHAGHHAHEKQWGVANYALLLTLVHWYTGFIGIRAYSNVAEALFVLVALLQHSYPAFLFWAALACSMRVTSIVPLLPQLFLHLVDAVRYRGGIIRGTAYIGVLGVVFVSLAFGLMAVADHMFYNRWICTPLEFIRFNVVENASRFFGTHPWHWYFSTVLPGMLGPYLLPILAVPFLLIGEEGRKLPSQARRLVWLYVTTILFTGVGYSALAHKEIRFIITSVPLSLVLVGFVLARMYKASSFVKLLHICCIVFNVVLLLVWNFSYRRGLLDIMADVRSDAMEPVRSLDVLTGCYTTPGYSYVHRKVEDFSIVMCPMEIDPVTKLPRVTERDLLSKHPKDFITWRYDGVHSLGNSEEDRKYLSDLKQVVPPKSRSLPEALVAFSYVIDQIEEPFLKRHGYERVKTYYHTFIPREEDEDVTVELWKRARRN